MPLPIVSIKVRQALTEMYEIVEYHSQIPTIPNVQHHTVQILILPLCPQNKSDRYVCQVDKFVQLLIQHTKQLF